MKGRNQDYKYSAYSGDPAMEKKYDESFIYPLLEKVLYCSCCTFSENGVDISTRFMVFACRENLREFYILTHGATRKVAEIRTNSRSTLSVISTAEVLDDFSETSVIGDFRIYTDFQDSTVQEGLKRIAKKSGMVQMLLDSGSLGEYVLLGLKMKEVSFRVYKDILQNVPATTIKV
jgi:hypothetical protein